MHYFQAARTGGYAVGAFIADTLDTMEAVADACAQAGLPAVMMAGMATVRFLGPERYVDLCRSVGRGRSIPVYAHLDHCTDRDLLLRCAEAGFDSVMFDGSQRPFAENVAICAELAKKCHIRGALLEGELGVIAGQEEHVESAVSRFTDPALAEEFVRRTGVDALAVSVGNAHGLYQGAPELQFPLLEELARRCAIPLVLHGGTGIPGADLRRAVSMGVCKINVGTELRRAYMDAVRDYASQEGGTAIGLSQAIRDRVRPAAARYLEDYRPGGDRHAAL
ncbi:class II fructose-bisphosphate aldolase [Intestinimonas sp.]|uniref:class II fructose-bisphosphate aldolase n=1 Tax=Intestinimonas sp. TaxID=1965293 RepID=UPI00261B01F2|nr:class II fructose-bisphosphate aldolase [Intestinimonas sp.]